MLILLARLVCEVIAGIYIKSYRTHPQCYWHHAAGFYCLTVLTWFRSFLIQSHTLFQGFDQITRLARSSRRKIVEIWTARVTTVVIHQYTMSLLCLRMYCCLLSLPGTWMENWMEISITILWNAGSILGTRSSEVMENTLVGLYLYIFNQPAVGNYFLSSSVLRNYSFVTSIYEISRFVNTFSLHAVTLQRQYRTKPKNI